MRRRARRVSVLCPGVGFRRRADRLRGAPSSRRELPDATYLALGFDSPHRPEPRHREDEHRRPCARRPHPQLRAHHGGRPRLPRARHRFRRRREERGDHSVGRRQHGLLHDGHPEHRGLSSRCRRQHRRAAPAQLRSARCCGSGRCSRWLKRQAAKGPRGPDAAARERSPAFVWGEAQAPSGEPVTARIRVANRLRRDGSRGARSAAAPARGIRGLAAIARRRSWWAVASSRRCPARAACEIIRGRAWEPEARRMSRTAAVDDFVPPCAAAQSARAVDLSEPAVSAARRRAA